MTFILTTHQAKSCYIYKKLPNDFPRRRKTTTTKYLAIQGDQYSRIASGITCVRYYNYCHTSQRYMYEYFKHYMLVLLLMMKNGLGKWIVTISRTMANWITPKQILGILLI